MANTDTNKPQHPGNHLKQILAEKGLLQSDLAFILGQAVASLNLIISGKRGISPDMSKALGKALGLPSEHFAKLQIAFDLAHANDPDPAITVRASILERYPIREMIKRGWIKDADAENIKIQLEKFFGGEIPYMAHAAKKSNYEAREIPAPQAAWLARVHQIARSLVAPKYSSHALVTTLDRFKELIISPEAARHVPRLLAECGVRYVIVETLPSAKIDGVCFWLNANAPVIGMSMRYDRIDNYWFVLRHEIEHVLRKHGMREEMVDAELERERASVNYSLSEEERIANYAAAEFCVPSGKLESFLRRKYPFYYEKDVLAFARLHGVHPGIVVGQMQHILDRYDYLKKHQVRIRQFVLPGAMADGWGQSMPI